MHTNIDFVQLSLFLDPYWFAEKHLGTCSAVLAFLSNPEPWNGPWVFDLQLVALDASYLHSQLLRMFLL